MYVQEYYFGKYSEEHFFFIRVLTEGNLNPSNDRITCISNVTLLCVSERQLEHFR